jgi:hypothetical protein
MNCRYAIELYKKDEAEGMERCLKTPGRKAVNDQPRHTNTCMGDRFLWTHVIYQTPIDD